MGSMRNERIPVLELALEPLRTMIAGEDATELRSITLLEITQDFKLFAELIPPAMWTPQAC